MRRLRGKQECRIVLLIRGGWGERGCSSTVIVGNCTYDMSNVIYETTLKCYIPWRMVQNHVHICNTRELVSEVTCSLNLLFLRH